VIQISVPALRERTEDLPLLAEHFLRKYAHECPFTCPHLSERAIHVLTGYSWPGNIRELESAIRRALILAENETLEPSDFPACIGSDEPSRRIAAGLSFQKAKASLVQQFEKQYLVKLMKDHLGNVSRASRAAGTPRRCLQRLLQKHGLRSASQ
jgi:DNA-binding NtrC family response regulator